jgi:cbb3-type cytochrome oxidase maturation protein
MESLYILVPLSIALVFLAIRTFFGASDSGQFDDLVGPGLRVLADDDRGKADKNAGPDTSQDAMHGDLRHDDRGGAADAPGKI